MRQRLFSIGTSLRDVLHSARDSLPEVGLISDVEVPVYVLHHGPDAEDYELICDFERFMSASQTGLLRRPVLRVWSGRSDFERVRFARHLREAFSTQFDLVRTAHRAEVEARRSRWTLQLPSLGEILIWGLTRAGGLAGSILLYLATAVGGKAVDDGVDAIRRALGSTADPEAELETLIETKKGVIDEALSRIEITLHRDLYAYAWRGQPAGPMTGIDRDAWPLPDFVRERLVS